MGTISCTSEIVEAMDLRLKMDDYVGKRRMLKSGQICSIEDDINKLFEAIDIRTSRRSSGLLQQVGKDSLGKRAMKKPMRPGLSQASGIGISEPVNLKQALRGLCISQASEMAAMKRLSKPAGSSRASEAGTIKRLHRAVVVETSKSGLPHNEGNGNLVEISLVPVGNTSNISEKVYESVQLPKVERLNHGAQSSTLLGDTPTSKVKVAKTGPDDGEYEISMAELGQNEKSTLTYSTSSVNASEKLPALDEISPASAEVPIKLVEPDKVQKRKLHFASSLSGSRCISVFGNKIKSKVKKDAASVPSSSNQCHGAVDNDLVCKETNGALKCRSKQKEKSSPTSCTTNVSSEVSSHAMDSDFAKPISNSSLSSRTGSIVSKADETSRSREKGEFTQSSKSSIGEYSSSTSISEESILSGSSRSGYRPHMSKDLRWEGIHHVQKQHVSLGLRHFKLLKKVGSGDIGSVYLSELTGTSCHFALKIIDIEFLATKKKAHRAQTEREVLQMLDHPFLPTLYAHFTTDKYSCLVMEYCPGGDLHVLRQKQPSRSFSEQAARFYVAEVLLALEYLHMLGVVYRDLKPENILVREDGHIMLSDFDLSLRCAVNPMLLKSSPTVESSQGETTPCAESICIHSLCLQPSWEVPCFTPRLISSAGKTRKLRADLSALVSPLPQLVAEPTSARSNSFVGTHEYLAPEIIKGEGHGSAVDWWTFGIFLYELLYGGTPFKGSRNEDTLSNVVSHSLSFPKNPIVTSHARDLIRGLLEKEPVNRLGSVKGAVEIKQHPFFEGLNWALIRCAVPPELPMIFDFGYDIADTSPQDKESSTRSQEEFKSTGEHLEFNMF